MPASENSRRATVVTSSSRSNPTAAKTGARCTALGVGLVLCATTQIEHEDDSVRFA